MEKFLEAGRVLSTHGVKGEVKIEPWTDSPRSFLKLKTLYVRVKGEKKPLHIDSARTAGALVLCKFREYDAPETASVLRGQTLWFDREEAALPPERFYLADAVGLSVLDAETGRELGKITGLSDTGFQILFEAVTPEGKNFLIPNVPAFVREVSPEQGFLKINLISGLIDEPESVEEESDL